MKTLGYIMLVAGGVAVYTHVGNPFHRRAVAPPPPPAATATPQGEIVIAPFKGTTIEERWKNPPNR